MDLPKVLHTLTHELLIAKLHPYGFGKKSLKYHPRFWDNFWQLKVFKNDDNTFYFMLKTVLFLTIFTLLSWLFGCVEIRLDKKAKINFKIMTSETEQQIITIHTLPNISRTKGNQSIKFGQLIKCNERNIFLNKSCRKWGRKTSSRPLFCFLSTKTTFKICEFFFSQILAGIAEKQHALAPFNFFKFSHCLTLLPVFSVHVNLILFYVTAHLFKYYYQRLLRKICK